MSSSRSCAGSTTVATCRRRSNWGGPGGRVITQNFLSFGAPAVPSGSESSSRSNWSAFKAQPSGPLTLGRPGHPSPNTLGFHAGTSNCFCWDKTLYCHLLGRCCNKDPSPQGCDLNPLTWYSPSLRSSKLDIPSGLSFLHQKKIAHLAVSPLLDLVKIKPDALCV